MEFQKSNHEIVKVVLGQCSYKGPDLHCYSRHQEFFHHLGRLQERSWWLTNAHQPCSDPPTIFAFQDKIPEFRFFTGNEVGNSLIGQARDNIVQRAIEISADYLMFFDDDMLFDNDAFLRLWRHQKEIIGALAFTSRVPIAPVLWQFKRTWNFAKQCQDVDAKVMFDYPKDQLVEVGCIGSGVILIKMEVFRKIKRPWFHGAINSGEDFHFCWQALKAGIPIFCDTSVKTSHRPNVAVEWHNEESYLNSPRSALRFNK